MPQTYYITPVPDDGGEEPPSVGGGPIYPEKPHLPPEVGGGPVYPPSLPGIWPPAGVVKPPIQLPPDHVGGGPITLPLPPVTPGQPLPPIPQPPPGIIWPPLPPDSGIAGKTVILIKILGVKGFRWYVYDPALETWPPSTPTPK